MVISALVFLERGCFTDLAFPDDVADALTEAGFVAAFPYLCAEASKDKA